MYKLKFFRSSVIGAGLVVLSQAAQAEWDAEVSMKTDYVWRGVSQTDEDPAIQGGASYLHGSGIYVGTWGSNVEYGDEAHMQHDLYAGWKRSFKNFTIDAGVRQYNFYNSDADRDFSEAYIGGGYGPISVRYWAEVSDEDIGDYLEANADFSLPKDFGLHLHAGHYDYDDGTEYVDYGVGLAKWFNGWKFDLTYYDTDDDGVDLFGDRADDRVVFGVSRSL